MGVLAKIKQHNIKDIFNILLAKYFRTSIMKLHYLKVNIDYNKALKEINNLEFEVKELDYNDFYWAIKQFLKAINLI